MKQNDHKDSVSKRAIKRDAAIDNFEFVEVIGVPDESIDPDERTKRIEQLVAKIILLGLEDKKTSKKASRKKRKQ